jgi:hypothetical protein
MAAGMAHCKEEFFADRGFAGTDAREMATMRDHRRTRIAASGHCQRASGSRRMALAFRN